MPGPPQRARVGRPRWNRLGYGLASLWNPLADSSYRLPNRSPTDPNSSTNCERARLGGPAKQRRYRNLDPVSVLVRRDWSITETASDSANAQPNDIHVWQWSTALRSPRLPANRPSFCDPPAR